MDTQIRKVLNAYEAGMVQRYHTHPRLARTGQTNAHHQWSVAVLLLSLHPAPSKHHVLEALSHDMGERFAGDIPRPVKVQNPELAAAHALLEEYMRKDNFPFPVTVQHDDQKLWTRMLDSMECLMWAALSAPDILDTPPWVELETYVVQLSKTVRPAPVVSVSELLDALRQTRGCMEPSSVVKEN